MPIKKNTLVSGTKKTIKKISRKAESALVSSTIIALEHAQIYTPLQFGVLRNSQFRSAPKNANGKITVVSGYDASIIDEEMGYGASYALALHERTDWKPRRVGDRGKEKGGANMRAKPKFLKLGFEETKQKRFMVIKKIMAI